MFSVKTSRSTLISKVVDGVYPDYMKVIPADLDGELEIDAKDLTAAVARVNIFAEDRSNGIKLSISQDNMKISLPRSSIGSAEEVIACAYEGQDALLGFNSRFLLSCVQNASSDTVRLHFGTPGQPALIEDGDTLMLIMPMRVN